jgi:micrococcal nuclease
MPVTPQLARLLLAAPLACGLPDSTTAEVGGDDDPISLCGPSRASVASVIDGDTIVLTSGEKVRYLMVDSPEITNGKNDCYGAEARDYNEGLVLGQEVELTYDVECMDAYGRLLAYVEAPDGEANTLMVERGFACVLILPPNGEARESEFNNLELAARQSGAGMWGDCGEDIACD